MVHLSLHAHLSMVCDYIRGKYGFVLDNWPDFVPALWNVGAVHTTKNSFNSKCPAKKIKIFEMVKMGYEL